MQAHCLIMDLAVMNRRRALGVIGSGAAIASSGALSKPVRSSGRPLGLADLTVIKALSADYAGTLKSVAAMGYTHFGFRLAGHGGNDKSELSAVEKAKLVRAAGLKVGPVRFGFGRSFAEQAQEAAKIDAKIIAYSAAPVFFQGGKLGTTTRAAFDAWLPELATMSRISRELGLVFAYHNHWWDHIPLGDATPLDIIAKTFSPKDVSFEIDLAWAYLGGVDPYALVARLGRRVVSMHYKDVDPSRGEDRFKQLLEPGAGVLGFGSMLPKLDTISKAVGYVEVDAPTDGMAAAKSAADFLISARRRPT